MKWREPWRESIRAQALFNPFGKAVAKGFLGWLALFMAMFLFLSYTGGAVVGLLDMFWMALLIAGGLAWFNYIARWLSPRKISSGPRGIMIAKADGWMLLPWAAIENFSFSSRTSPTTLLITLGSGQVFSLTLRHDSDRTEIEREIRAKMLEVQASRPGENA